MSNAEDNALTLTAWGTTTIGALQGATEAEREEIARRACEDAITDARSMASLQGSLFEKLLVIERFGLYRAQGCESIQEFLERAVAPHVQLHRKTLYKLREAVWEAGRLLERYGTLKADWSNLYLLATETRRREKGAAVLASEDYERVSRQVAEGQLTQRDLLATLQRRPTPAPPKRTRCIDAPPPPKVPRATPFEELARISDEARRPAARRAVDLGRALELAELLAGELEHMSLRPADAWRLPSADRARLSEGLERVVEASTAVIAAAKTGCAA